MNFILGTSYFIGDLNTRCSDRSAERIKTLDECKAAADDLEGSGHDWMDFYGSIRSPTNPEGCYYDTYEEVVYYNTITKGKAKG